MVLLSWLLEMKVLLMMRMIRMLRSHRAVVGGALVNARRQGNVSEPVLTRMTTVDAAVVAGGIVELNRLDCLAVLR